MSGPFDNLLRLQSLDEGECRNISAGLRPPHSIFTKTEVSALPSYVCVTPQSRHRRPRLRRPFRANARNRCAIARCAGSPTASAVTGGKIVKTRNRCAHSSVEAVRLVCEHGGHG